MNQVQTLEQDEAYINAKEVREKNDLLRTTFFPWLGKVVMTQGVAFHPEKEEISTRVREFNAFTEDNDPHHEHDCAIIKFKCTNGEEVRAMFKIDYYDSNYKYHSDPHENKCYRVLTILLASEC